MIVSGDAHMLAIDDGTSANYTDQGGPKIPVLQAGALDMFPILGMGLKGDRVTSVPSLCITT